MDYKYYQNKNIESSSNILFHKEQYEEYVCTKFCKRDNESIVAILTVKKFDSWDQFLRNRRVTMEIFYNGQKTYFHGYDSASPSHGNELVSDLDHHVKKFLSGIN